jgi:hypothetical protein
VKWQEYARLEREEMQRHKWIASEKAGRDLGQAALMEWIEKHAAAFRAYVTHTLGKTIRCDDEPQRAR